MNTTNKNKTLCLFGTYESHFPRIKTLINASKLNKYKIISCHSPYWELQRQKEIFFNLKTFFLTFFQLGWIYLKLTVKFLRQKKTDLMMVGYNGYFDMPLAKLLSRLKKIPLVYTPVFPLYETLVEDRKYVNQHSLKSKLIHKVDETACRLADLIILETEEYIRYYQKEFGIPYKKFTKIPLGADENNFYPRSLSQKKSNQTKILFYGKFIPLQGISYIIKAAKILEKDKNIHFEVIGSGQLSEKIRNLSEKLNIKNVHFIPWVDYQNLPFHIQTADICLGIFGKTPKAQRGIPIKVYEALLMNKPVITGKSPAAREVFTHKQNAVLCKMADASALAEAILFLKNNGDLREKIAKEGHLLYQQLFSSSSIAKDLRKAIEKLDKLENKNKNLRQ